METAIITKLAKNKHIYHLQRGSARMRSNLGWIPLRCLSSSSNQSISYNSFSFNSQSLTNFLLQLRRPGWQMKPSGSWNFKPGTKNDLIKRFYVEFHKEGLQINSFADYPNHFLASLIHTKLLSNEFMVSILTKFSLLEWNIGNGIHFQSLIFKKNSFSSTD